MTNQDREGSQARLEDGASQVAVAYFGRFEGPDHLFVNCPALARVKPWKQPWPAITLDLVDPHGTDLCGWCVRTWNLRSAGSRRADASHDPVTAGGNHA